MAAKAKCCRNIGFHVSARKQLNKQTDFTIDYVHSFNKSLNFETGYDFNSKDLLNDFNSESQAN